MLTRSTGRPYTTLLQVDRDTCTQILKTLSGFEAIDRKNEIKAGRSVPASPKDRGPVFTRSAGYDQARRFSPP